MADTVTLYCGDCLEILPTLEAGSVDAVITDPPYLEGDFSHLVQEFQRLATRFVLTPGKLESFNWIRRERPTWEYAWESHTQSLGGRACFHIGWEPILSYGWPIKPIGNDLLIYPIGQPDQKNGHKWAKPIGLITKLVEFWSNPGDLILDPFMGSGTTGVACVQTGRRFIGIEIDPNYYAIAEKRIKEAQQQLRMPI